MRASDERKNRRGSILVTLLFLLSILAMLVATVANDSMQSMKSVSQSGRDTQAKYGAYAGMERVMNELRKDDYYSGEEPLIDDRHGRFTGQLGSLEKIDYEVLIWNNMQSEDDTEEREPMNAPNGVQVYNNTVYMISKGEDRTQGEDVILSSLGGTARRIRPVFEDAAYARNKIVLQGDAMIDAWDSGGGWTPYVQGSFPGESSGTGSGGSGGSGSAPSPTTVDHAATIGTDNARGRTARLLSGAKLNGHYRVGPGVTDERAFSDDSGTTSTSSGGARSDGGTTTTYGVTTAVDPNSQIAGTEGAGDHYQLDDKRTEVPVFVAPYESDDLQPPLTINNAGGSKTVTDKYGNKYTVPTPPAPYDLAPGGYESIDVRSNQKLRLSPGVYYFHEDMEVNNAEIEVTGSDPVIVFVGKKATFNNSRINENGRTTSLQLCFTDEEKDADVLSSLVGEVQSYFEPPSSSTSADDGGGIRAGTTTSGTTLQTMVASLLAPQGDPTVDEDNEGTSVLRMNGTSFTGSISGKNMVTIANGGDIFGGIMGNVILGNGTGIHQDLSLKGSNLMNSGGWALEGVHQLR